MYLDMGFPRIESSTRQFYMFDADGDLLYHLISRNYSRGWNEQKAVEEKDKMAKKLLRT